jgi:hypothetical protein
MPSLSDRLTAARASSAAGVLLAEYCRDVQSPASNDASELTRVVDVSAKIHQLSRDAAQMRIQAVNARLQTRTDRTVAPGFEMVAIHMGELSQDIDASASRLRGLTVDWVRAVSGLLGCHRERTLLDEVDAASAPLAIAAARARNDDRRQTLGDHIERCRRAFLTELEATEQMSAMGRVLASSAKIEAAYGGPLAGLLGGTAATFAGLAHDVHESVRSLIRRSRMRREATS